VAVYTPSRRFPHLSSTRALTLNINCIARRGSGYVINQRHAGKEGFQGWKGENLMVLAMNGWIYAGSLFFRLEDLQAIVGVEFFVHRLEFLDGHGFKPA
jgi:hypothetical protein